jgi:hypothetical protein
MGLVVLGSVLAACLAAATGIDSSRAGATPVGLTVRIDGGETSQTDHLHSTGLGGTAPPLYFDLAIQQRVGRRFFAGLTGGLSFDVGPFFYPNIRYGMIDGETGTLTIGAGPMFQDLASGWTTFAAADVTGQLALGSTFIVSAGADYAIAVQRRGAPTCGADTCDAYVSRGDHILVFRAGLGFRI